MKNVILLALLALVMISCGDDDKPTSPSTPKVFSLSPDKGSIGTQVAISGENFPTNKSEITVKFNATTAIIDSAKTNYIYVRVPAGAQSGKVTVTIKSVAYEAGDFMVLSSSGSLLPMVEGNYWVYTKYQLDTNDVLITANPGRDSVLSAGSVIKLGKNAKYLSTFSKLDMTSAYQPGPDQFYYEENGILYSHSSWFDDLMSFGGGGFQLPFDIEEQWMKLVDPQSNEWEIYTRQFLSEPFSFGTLTGTLTLVGINLGTSNLTVGGRAYNDSRMINFRFRFVGVANSQFGEIPLNLERVLSVWYAPSVGRVKSKMNAMRFVIPGIADQIIPGYELHLIESKLN